MKRYIFGVLLCALVSMQASAQVEWLSTVHDFGAFNEDMGPVSCEFVYVNRGSEAVAIVGARANCGCTAPVYSREPVAPGDTASVLVSYDPAGRPGHFDKYVSVDFSIPDSRSKLKITGTVIGSPASVAQRYPAGCDSALQLARGAVMLGDVAKGQMRTVFLGAYNRSTDPIKPVINGLPPYVEASIEPAVVPPGEQTSFIFYFRSDLCPVYGLVSDSITVSSASGAPGCDISVVAMVREDFSRLSPGELQKAPVARLETNSLDFGEISRSGGKVSLTCALGNQGRRNLEIRRVYTTDTGVEVSVDRSSVKKGKEAVITVTVDPEQLTGALLNSRISVITNDPSNAVQTLRAVGRLH